MIDLTSFMCGAIVGIILQVILGITILKWYGRKKKGPDERKIVTEIIEGYDEGDKTRRGKKDNREYKSSPPESPKR